MSIPDILLLAVLICGVIAACRALKKGRGSCGGCNGDCESCRKKSST